MKGVRMTGTWCAALTCRELVCFDSPGKVPSGIEVDALFPYFGARSLDHVLDRVGWVAIAIHSVSM